MSDSQKKSFEKAGMVVEVDPDLKPNGRNVIKSIELTDSQGKKTKVTTEAELNKALKNNPTLRSMMYKGFNPRTAFFSIINSLKCSATDSKLPRISNKRR